MKLDPALVLITLQNEGPKTLTELHEALCKLKRHSKLRKLTVGDTLARLELAGMVRPNRSSEPAPKGSGIRMTYAHEDRGHDVEEVWMWPSKWEVTCSVRSG
jgi:predicted transcriptional regulator